MSEEKKETVNGRMNFAKTVALPYMSNDPSYRVSLDLLKRATDVSTSLNSRVLLIDKAIGEYQSALSLNLGLAGKTEIFECSVNLGFQISKGAEICRVYVDGEDGKAIAQLASENLLKSAKENLEKILAEIIADEATSRKQKA